MPVMPPAILKPRYRNRKGEISTNVLGVCTRDLKFVYVLSGWEGSATDSRILRDAIQRPHGLRVPHGMFVIDAKFVLYNTYPHLYMPDIRSECRSRTLLPCRCRLPKWGGVSSTIPRPTVSH